MRTAASSLRVRIVLGVLAALVLGGAGSAAAEKKRVGVPRFDGPQEGIVRKAVMQVLKGNGFDVVGAREIDAAAKATGAQLDSNDGFKTVAKELSISSFVTGEVGKKKAKLTVRNGADGSVSGEGSFAGANPKKVGAEVRDGLSRRLGSAIERGRAPSGAKKPTAAPVAEAEEPDEGEDAAAGGAAASSAKPASKPASSANKSAPAPSESAPEKTEAATGAEGVVEKKAPEDEGATGAGPRALDIGAGFRGFTRSLSYNQDLYGLRAYKLALGPAVALNVVAFPAAFATSGFAANIGVELNIEQAFGVASNVPGTVDANGAAAPPFPMGATFPTVIHDFEGGLRYRFVLSGGHEISLSAGGGEHAFSFRSSGGAPRAQLDIPDTIYRYVRIGGDARIMLPSGVTLGLGGAYRHVLNQGGQIAEPGFFPYLTVMGMDVNAKLGYQVTPSLEARIGLDLRRYGFAMNSDPTDVTNPNPALRNRVAGGAVDQYLSFTLGAAYVFGGTAAGADSEAAAEEAPPADTKKKKKKKKKSDDDEDGGGGGDSQGGGDDSDE
jgi:hypothetical protein